MGIIIAKFRKKPSTFEVLTKLENEIISIEDFQKRTQQTQRKIVFRFLILAILIYIALVFLLYFYFTQISPNQRLLWSIPLIAFPVVIWLIKLILTWYYNRKISKNEKKLVGLKDKKKKMLENVMETETYKVAKQILDKFGNETKKPVLPTPTIQRATSSTTSIRPYESATVLRQRNLLAMAGRKSFGGEEQTPVQSGRLGLLRTTSLRQGTHRQSPSGVLAIPSTVRPPLPRNILPQNRSVLDKMVEYLVGDGPSNRYALICNNCASHNGMAFKEEFEYLAFRCCYCNAFNPARKKRPAGPKFDSPLMLAAARTIGQTESSNSEKNSDDSDSSAEPIVEEPRGDSPDTIGSEKVSDVESHQNDNAEMEVDDSDSHQTTARVADRKDGEDVVETAGETADN